MFNLIATLAEHNCSPFFFTGAAQSAIFGEVGRHSQRQLMDDNLEFRERMQKLKDEFQEERFDEQIAFRRESFELGRQYLIQQNALSLESRQRETEFKDFLNRYWPLDISLAYILKQQGLTSRGVVPLNVLIARTEVSAFNRRNAVESYGKFCDSVSVDLSGLNNTTIMIRPWRESCKSILCESMNINYIMQGMPTLIVFPYQIGDTFGVEIASWMFNRGPKSMLQQKLLQIGGANGTTDYKLAVSAVKASIGMIRDTYMITQYHAPAEYPKLADKDTLSNPAIREAMAKYYSGIAMQIEANPDYLALCSPKEIETIRESVVNIKQLTA